MVVEEGSLLGIGGATMGKEGTLWFGICRGTVGEIRKSCDKDRTYSDDEIREGCA